MLVSRAVGLILSVALPSTATAKEAAPLTASSKWQADYGKTECRLLRTFGEGADRVTLQLSQISPEPIVSVSLSAPRIPATDTRRPGKALVADQRVDITAQGFAARSDTPAILEIQPSRELWAALIREAKSGKPTQLSIEFLRDWNVHLNVGLVQVPLSALNRCVDDLVRSWGLDPDEQRARRTGPIPATSMGMWVKPDEFPREQNRKGVGGTVIVRLGVDAQGGITDCAVARSGGDDVFQDLTCRHVKERGRFKPAIGADGKPIASFFTSRIDWVASGT